MTAYRTVTDAADFGRVAVLFGGTSAEREISLLTGQAVLDALLRRDVDAVAMDPADGLQAQLGADRFDRVWIALHGRGGEDGTVQGWLSLLGIPYTGSGVLGCALAMDKLRTKRLFAGCGLPTPDFVELRGPEDFSTVEAELGFPVMVKPADEGSSIGLTRVDDTGGLPAAYAAAAACNSAVFAERWMTGGEYTAAILHDDVLPLIRIDAGAGFYDYDAKYYSDETRYICPCGLPAEQEAEYGRLALDAFRAVGASGWGRVDFMLDATGAPLLLEVNTVPGMTSHSLVPMAAAQAGTGFDALVWRILETSCTEDADGRPA
ncbi:MAG: D-alanine--D-alanine ligase [Chromatiales bacterium]|nr:MAG: D-alanine--D-alanine ligase [Chromatiales bacterium]